MSAAIEATFEMSKIAIFGYPSCVARARINHALRGHSANGK